MSQGQVALADVFVVAPDVLAELGPAPREVARGRGPGGERDVHEVGRAAHHAAGRASPAQHHRAAARQLFPGARDDERKPQTLAAGRRHERHLVPELGVVLQIIERRDRVHAVREPGVPRDVLDALSAQPDLALLLLEALDVLGARPCGHGETP